MEKLPSGLELGPLAGADDGVAQSDLIGLGGQPQTDTAGGVLQIVVLAVHQRHNALDGELGVGGALQRRADGAAASWSATKW